MIKDYLELKKFSECVSNNHNEDKDDDQGNNKDRCQISLWLVFIILRSRTVYALFIVKAPVHCLKYN